MDEILSFDLIDDILNLPSSDYLPIAKSSNISRIAPLIEFAYFHYPNAVEYLRYWSASAVAKRFIPEVDSSSSTSSTKFPVPEDQIEFIRTPQDKNEIFLPRWSNYLGRAQKAAEASGIPKHLAMAIIGTLEEMTDNIIYHSHARETGLSGFRSYPGEFEYVVVDAGIGVLKSLKSNPKYYGLDDSLDALKLAIQSGVSRYSDIVDRGTGFNKLIRSIANQSCDLRFRSGMACIMFNGIEAQRSAKLIQKNVSCVDFNGFAISLLWKAN